MIIGHELLNGRSGHDAGRQLLAQLYRDHFGDELPDILLTPRGKPYFSTGNVHFSISHTKNHVFCVLADKAVGIDADELSRCVNLKLAQKILSPGELTQFEGAEDKNTALLTFWVLKEAAAKRSGAGLQGFPNHTRFSPDDPRVQQLSGCYLAVLTSLEGE